MSSKQSKANKKHSNKIKCTIYRARNTRIKNKISKLSRYCRHHLNDKLAQKRLQELKSL